ncbi:MAG: phosphonate transporter [Halobacteriovoraceae bacterium]|nr:phosphonate transporter [Halobacteriovoraceae bacterium]
MEFESVTLEELESKSESELDQVNFGIVGSNKENHLCTIYNKWETDLSGLSKDFVIGKNFYVDVAPCTNNFLVYNRYETELNLDETIDYVFTYKLSPTKVRIRMLKSQDVATEYLLVTMK